MDPSAVTIFALVMSLTWKVLVDTPKHMKNSLFDRFLTSSPILQSIATAATMSFAPGLLDVLQSATPPAIEFFKSMPSGDLRHIWGIYAIVLEKAGCRSKVYLGSATNVKDGVFFRWNQYDKGLLLPRWVGHALGEGYEIVHKGLICWAPIPGPRFVPARRLLFVALECTFAYIFWALKAQGGDYGMGHICTWNYRAMPYDGLCSHQCLTEGIHGEFDMTPDQLDAKAVDDELKFRELKKINATNHHHKQMAENYDEYMNKSHERVKKSRATNRAQHRKTEQKRAKKALADKRWHCSTCDRSFTSKPSYGNHMKSAKHLRKVNNTPKHWCVACNLGYDSLKDDHLKSKSHKANVARLANEAAKASPELV